MSKSEGKMKLTDLNIDCLETILELLVFGDFLSAADSNKRLNKAANFICNRNHRFKWIFLSLGRVNILKESSSAVIGQKPIQIVGLKTCLKLLRCFGHLISIISIQNEIHNQSEHVKQIFSYLNEYCSDSITQIGISCDINGWKNLQKPFSKVKFVTLYECEAFDGEYVNRLFPKMSSLHYYNYSNKDKLLFITAAHFPNLKEFFVLIHSMMKTYGDLLLAPILRLNPQLTLLVISASAVILNSLDFQNAIETLQKLERLIFNMTWSSESIERVFHLKSVKEFVIGYDYSGYVRKIPFSFDQLVRLNIFGSKQLPVDFFSFIDKHPTITNLHIDFDNLSVIDQMKIAKSLPSLEIISVLHARPVQESIQFLFNFPQVTKFEFHGIQTTAFYNDF